ncbi:MAG: hypothetical protein AB8B60_04825 [Sulfitobacter sp.]
MRRTLIALLFAGMAPALAAQTVTQEEGVAAWDRIYAVASHPRCSNCHVGAGKEPMWDGLGYGPDRVHGMGIMADESRIGAESIPCRACHVTSSRPNAVPHAPPHIEDAWRLPPVELGWHKAGSGDLCAQFRDPERMDGMEIADLVDHVQSSPFVAWGFNPGGGRSAPEGSVLTLAADLRLWGAAGRPCQ